MEKTLIIVKWLGLGFLMVIILGIVASFINHTARLSQEEAAFPPPGKMVSVNDHQLHVYLEGNGDLPLVFLAGSGTSSPTLNFKPLYRQFTSDYRIAVIERSGYGWSEMGSTPRNIETLVSENRKALALAEVEPPYVVLAHSMGALEAIFWANQYPDEILAIIGLDPAIPEAYHHLPQPPALMIHLMAFLARTGITRLSPAVCQESLALQEEYLTAEEANAFCAVFYRSTLTKNMLDELKAVETNALLVQEQGIPDVPMLFFISDGEELGLENWRSLLITYVEAAPQGEFMTFDVGHYIHNHEPERIGAESRIFLQAVAEGQGR